MTHCYEKNYYQQLQIMKKFKKTRIFTLSILCIASLSLVQCESGFDTLQESQEDVQATTQETEVQTNARGFNPTICSVYAPTFHCPTFWSPVQYNKNNSIRGFNSSKAAIRAAVMQQTGNAVTIIEKDANNDIYEVPVTSLTAYGDAICTYHTNNSVQTFSYVTVFKYTYIASANATARQTVLDDIENTPGLDILSTFYSQANANEIYVVVDGCCHGSGIGERVESNYQSNGGVVLNDSYILLQE